MSKFTIHHVGARFGNMPFAIPGSFADSIEIVLFDADDDCIEGLIDQGGEKRFRTSLVSACLSNKDSTAYFNITINPSASSLLEPSDAPRGFVQPLFGIDWDVSQAATVIERRAVATCRLDTLLSQRRDFAQPDLLSLDTQGSELQILEGARNTIVRRVVAVIVEVEFIELYKNVSRFGDVAQFLENMGFHFARFIDVINAQPSRQPVGCRSDGFAVAADALFLRKIKSIGQPDRDYMLEKLAFASVLFGHLDHAFAALNVINSQGESRNIVRWRNFVRQLHLAAADLPKIYLPRFPDILPKRSIKRFSQETDISKWGSLMDLGMWCKELETLGLNTGHELDELENRANSPIEVVLRQHGFSVLADRTNFCRRDQAHKLRQFLATGS